MRTGWHPTVFDGACLACAGDVPTGAGWVLPRPARMGAGRPVLLCRACAVATAPANGLAGRLERLRDRPPVVRGVPYHVSPYQAEGAAFLASRWRACLTDDKGLGKTMEALLALPDQAPAVIVCPAQVKTVWAREFAIWRPEYEVAVLRGRRSWQAPRPGRAVVLNYEILPQPPEATCRDCAHEEAEHVTTGCHVCGCPRFAGVLPSPAEVADLLGLEPGTVLIADEAHKAKGARSARTRRLRYLVQGCSRAWALTASPIMNHPKELWSIYRVFGLAKAAFGRRRTFDQLFRGYEDHGSAPTTAEGQEIQRRRALVELGRSADDVGLQLPPLRFEERVVQIDATALEAVEQALGAALAGRRAWQELRAGLIDEDELEERRAELLLTSHTDEDVLALVQAVIEAREWGDIAPEISRLRRALAVAKIPAALAYAEECEAAGEPLVVFSSHVAIAEAVGGRQGWGNLRDVHRRAQLVDAFQAGELRGLAGTIRASGEGITLTAARLCLIADPDWTPEANDQAAMRIYRRGQTRACLITTLVADHPLDRFVGLTLRRKAAMIQASTRRAIR